MVMVFPINIVKLTLVDRELFDNVLEKFSYCQRLQFQILTYYFYAR